MTAKKVFIIVLIVLALCIWGRNIAIVFTGGAVETVASKDALVNTDVLTSQLYTYKNDFRDPFFCGLFMSNDSAKSARVAKPSAVKVSLPPCSIGGIVYDERNAMALFTVNGQSFTVKQGDVVDSITIKKILRDSVVVVFKGKTFTIGK